MIAGGTRDFADVAELERIATEGWASGVRAFVQAGAGYGRGIRANRVAHAKWSLRARVLVDVSCVDTATTALVPLDLPVMIAPSALHTLVWPEGRFSAQRCAVASLELSSTMARVGSTAISEIDVSRIGAASSIQEIV
ncbi:MAG TPA: alpha-hydroxy-acid oxidizing protein [Pseudonocardia sp.]|uniref:alpha-hydroxy-acid oxidizing protein n=1 Tax=Pseudonocardia sp. TaxID=60912 RepID=UPI002CF9558B|nr:alpha-hydroxy-acid oxidizing protein [Pseudonocardia sp.]HTF49268.1 alpha-hydroxy-acid oxidizing protein [Pseudonocardia sp.]